MIRWITLFVMLCVFAFSGCATTQRTTSKNDDKTVCRDVTPTGSRIPQRVCETPEDAEDRSVQDQLEWERMQRNTPASLPNQ